MEHSISPKVVVAGGASTGLLASATTGSLVLDLVLGAFAVIVFYSLWKTIYKRWVESYLLNFAREVQEEATRATKVESVDSERKGAVL